MRTRPDDQRGSTLPATLIAIGFSLVMLVGLVQIIVWQYARASVRTALDESARIGALQGPAACEDHARGVLDQTLGGPIGDDITIVCTIAPDAATATAQVTFRGWLAGTPDWNFTLTASAAIERTDLP